MKNKKLPYCYSLIRCGEDNEDLLFKRIRESSTRKYAPNVWAMHLDIEDLTPAIALIFVNGTAPRETVIDEINKAQTFFREQIEPSFFD